MYKYCKMLILGAALVVPGAISAQDHDRDKDHGKRYEDKNHGSHEWNDNEDRAYRRYLQEHHKKYHEFAKAKKKEQDDYWRWRQSHNDNDHDRH